MRTSSLLALLATGAQAIWPLPSKYTSGHGVLFIDQAKVKVTYNGPGHVSLSSLFPGDPMFTYGEQQPQGNKQSGTAGAPRIISSAIDRTYDTLFNKNFVPWMLHPRLSNFEPSPNGAAYVSSIVLDHTGPDPGADAAEVDESYSLQLTKDGKVTVTAKTAIGILYGLTSFTQLFYKHSNGDVYTDKAPVSITDSPKFKWRGLNVDTSRTFKPMADMYRTVDALAYNKFNRLHWHVTDAQTWPIEIPSMPELADKGVYVNSQRYTAEDFKALQEYGEQLGVNVVTEFDNPGHTSSIWFSHPDLIAAFNVQPDWTNYCAEPPCGTLKLNSPKVYAFLEKLLDDWLPRVTGTRYFHLGGDEVNKNAYTLDDTVHSNASNILQPLMQKYMDRNMNQVTKKYSLTPLVWEEMLLEWNLTLPKDTIVQTWQSDEAVLQTVQKGYRALAGNSNYWYLDCGKGQWLDFYPQNAAGFWPFTDYCSPVKSWRDMYSYDPLQGVPPNLQHLVHGGETHIWSEQTDSVNLDKMVWPRACAAGEVLWSGAKDASGQNRSQVEASPRLAEMRERLVARGVGAEPIQMPFCTQNGTQCAFPAP
ncbi:glycoside hydrolase family 20 [Lecanosticta acicola]|uniref:Beta-hexosaminidase n=1 Tax=Lecanosticta acicola TaxID=111012 RepID=A0AAI8Z632_9PEZI|nr:glycoside hydrolase family 20 [Lecanosticta acicola]